MARKPFKFDVTLALAVVFLLIFGLIMITSIGVPKSISLSAPNIAYPSCSNQGVDCYLLFKKHLFRLLVGLGAFLLAFKIPIRLLKKLATPLFVGAILFLVIVLAFGTDRDTIAKSWITIFETSIQPSEFAKLGLIVYLSYWFAKRKASVESFNDGFLPFCLVSGMVILPVMLQNDYGSMMVLAFIAVSIYYVAGAKIKHLALGFMIASLSAVVVATTVDHVQERLQGFMSVDEECVENYCWQSQQANIAVGSGGFFGKGLTQGVQKSLWLPQASDDFIFAASAEELGFFRIVFVILAYLIIALRGYKIADRASNNFELYLATGLTTWLVIQAFINIGVNTALIPVTGITLPFVSYGGSSLVASLIAVGILLNISKNSNYYEGSLHRGRNRRSRNPKLGRYRRA